MTGSESVIVTAPDGRSLEVAVAGPEDGELLLLHTGTPGGGVLYEPSTAKAAERGLREATYSRPGYGGSDRNEGRTVADCVADAAAIGDALGAERFYTLGGSGGGPHALACAALLPDRIACAVSVAGVAPFEADGLDWTAGMGQENLDEFAAAREGGATLVEFLEGMADHLKAV